MRRSAMSRVRSLVVASVLSLAVVGGCDNGGGGNACERACDKLESCSPGTTCTADGDCVGQAKQVADCINAAECSETAACILNQGACTNGAVQCGGSWVQTCTGGAWVNTTDCA